MILDTTSAIEILKNPSSKHEIQSIKNQESQLRVFTEEMSDEEIKSENYWSVFQGVIKKRMPKKFERIGDFVRFPLPIVQLSDSILNDYFKVFDGKNRFFNTTADRDIKRLQDWIHMNHPEKWIEEKARIVLKNKPNSFVVVDIDENSNPYLILIDSKRIVDATFKKGTAQLQYIAFIHSQSVSETNKDVIITNYSVYDDENYFVFSKASNQDTYSLVSESKHGIGYCPARAFVDSETNSKNPFKRRVAFSPSLSKLEDWTLNDIYRNYVDHYAPFPVTEAPVQTCVNSECQNGKVSEEIVVDHRTGDTKTVWSDCGACNGGDNGSNIGPGTHIGVRVSADKDRKDASGVFRIITPDTQNLKFIPEKLENLELDIKLKTTGLNTMTNNEAFNELQVKGSFASMESVLLRSKVELDNLYKWIITTVSKIMYKSIDVNVEANFGTEFYLISEKDLQERYEKAKEIGLPIEELMQIYLQIIETKYKGNAVKIERQKMLLKLDPLPLYSKEETIELSEKGIIDNFDLNLKINFLNFIAKFESENTSIEQFGLLMSPYERIDKIKETLNSYNDENIKSKQLRTGSEGTGES